jgi:hypothetical protein
MIGECDLIEIAKRYRIPLAKAYRLIMYLDKADAKVQHQFSSNET